jgi:DNA gyrase/topoisomerase IV subunit A
MGNGAAASRYTECSLSQFGYDVLLEELDQSRNIVDWVDTYKRNGIKEPEYLPTKLPIILVNGTTGIGVGLAVNVPSHNLGDVVDATIALLHNPKQKITLIPDFCQPCELIGDNWETISMTLTLIITLFVKKI